MLKNGKENEINEEKKKRKEKKLTGIGLKMLHELYIKKKRRKEEPQEERKGRREEWKEITQA